MTASDNTPVHTAPSAGTPTSWRDVYQLVQDVENRLGKRIDDGFTSAAAIAGDHEIRLRVLERSDLRNLQSDATMKTAITSAQKVIIAAVMIANFTVAFLALFRPTVT